MGKSRSRSILPFMVGISFFIHVLFFILAPRFSGNSVPQTPMEESPAFSLIEVAALPDPEPEPEPLFEPPPVLPQSDEGSWEIVDEAEDIPAVVETIIAAAPERSVASQTPRESRPRNNTATQAYVKKNFNFIQRRIRDRLRYPDQARRAGIQGSAELAFTILMDGSVQDVRITVSSGEALLDEAAIDAIFRSAPFPQPPEQARIAVPIVFRLR
jgi:protein TonB